MFPIQLMEQQQAMTAIKKGVLLKRIVPAVTFSLATAVAGVTFAESQVQVIESQPVGFAGPSTSNVVIESTSVAANPAAPASASGGSELAVLLNQVDFLQQEVLQLRGSLEEQANQIQQLQQEQRDRYLELDRRISRLSGETVTDQVTPNPVAPAQPSVSIDAGSSSLISTPAAAGSSTEQTGSVSESAYEQMIELIRERKFDDALVQLRAYSAQYPDSKYSANVHYWLGEVYIVKQRPEEARDAFLTVLQKYPQSNKVPDATYKLGTLFNKLGNPKLAQEYLEAVIKRYPETSAAKLSETYLRNNMS
ncbi:tol-pal system protein YbgF [Spongorhabdus nitratireducens]